MNELAYYMDRYFAERNDDGHHGKDKHGQQPLPYKPPVQGGDKYSKVLVLGSKRPSTRNKTRV
jgi:hypothetical protein